MNGARRARVDDLAGMLALFAASEVSRAAEPLETAQEIWRASLDHPGVSIFVAEQDGAIVSTCMLVTAPNLLRGGRGHAFLENVVTHPARRGRGHGRAVVAAALEEARRRGCFHVMVQSGRKDPRVRAFYESCGFAPDLRTAYVARLA